MGNNKITEKRKDFLRVSDIISLKIKNGLWSTKQLFIFV